MTLHLATRVAQVGRDLRRAVEEPGEDLAPAALAIARLEYPCLDAARYLSQLDYMGEQAASRIKAAAGVPREAVKALGEYLYDEQGFRGNREPTTIPATAS